MIHKRILIVLLVITFSLEFLPANQNDNNDHYHLVYFNANNYQKPLEYYQYLSKDPINMEKTHQLEDIIQTKLKSAKHDLSVVFLGMGDINAIMNQPGLSEFLTERTAMASINRNTSVIIVEYPMKLEGNFIEKTLDLRKLLWSSKQSEIIANGIEDFIVAVFDGHDKQKVLPRIKLYAFSMGVHVVNILCKLLETRYDMKPESVFAAEPPGISLKGDAISKNTAGIVLVIYSSFVYGANPFNRNLGHINIIVILTNNTFKLEINAYAHAAAPVIMLEALAKTKVYRAYKDKTLCNSDQNTVIPESDSCLLDEIKKDGCSPGTYYLSVDLKSLLERVFGKQKEKKNQSILDRLKSLFV